MTHRVAMGLGANLGDTRRTLQLALERLEAHPQLSELRVSSVFETAPVGPPDQPRYLNLAATAQTSLAPLDLLETLLSLERFHGRVRGDDMLRWGARTLDLDILLVDDLIIDGDSLTVPHPRMAERGFVLAPLAEIAPAWVHPQLGLTVEALAAKWAAGADPSAVRRLPERLFGGACDTEPSEPESC